MGLRNLPCDKATCLSDLIEARPGQVSSMSLASAHGIAATLLAFSAGESVSEEAYAGDTLYQCVDGRMVLLLSAGRVEVAAGQVLCVPAGTMHAVESADGGSFKVLQLTVS